jgi:hypothetical protein
MASVVGGGRGGWVGTGVGLGVGDGLGDGVGEGDGVGTGIGVGIGGGVGLGVGDGVGLGGGIWVASAALIAPVTKGRPTKMTERRMGGRSRFRVIMHLVTHLASPYVPVDRGVRRVRTMTVHPSGGSQEVKRVRLSPCFASSYNFATRSAPAASLIRSRSACS